LSVGYFTGYFLLLFRGKPTGYGRVSPWSRTLNAAITGAVWVFAILASGGMISRNLPQIKVSNGPYLKQYASLLAKALPAQNTVVLSDDPSRLFLTQAAVGVGRSNYMFLDTGSMKYPDYHAFLKKRYGRRWLAELPKDRERPLEDIELLQ